LRPIGFISGDLKEVEPVAVLSISGGENFADAQIRECLPGLTNSAGNCAAFRQGIKGGKFIRTLLRFGRISS
jgi:hypothetical protein